MLKVLTKNSKERFNAKEISMKLKEFAEKLPDTVPDKKKQGFSEPDIDLNKFNINEGENKMKEKKPELENKQIVKNPEQLKKEVL